AARATAERDAAVSTLTAEKEAERKVLEQSIAELDVSSRTATERVTALEAELAQRTTAVENFSRELGEARGKIGELEKELVSVGTDLANTRAQLESESGRARRATDKWDRDRVSLERAKDALAEALTRIEEAEHDGST
ncbi:MAG: hypothetical protein ABI175_22440, partial [Polyangiales bacterium]